MSSLFEIQDIFDEILNNNNLKNYDDAITKYNIVPLLGLDKQMKITLIDDSEYYINEDEIFINDFYDIDYDGDEIYTSKIKEIVFQKDTILNMSLRSIDDYIPPLFGRLEKISYLNNDTGEKVKVKLVGDCSYLFFFNEEFDENINDWDVSQVTNMSYMFYDCINFNQPLNNWDVSRVTNMSYMFYDCINFNQPLNKWDVSRVIAMDTMFLGCENFNQNINTDIVFDVKGNIKYKTWDVSQVINMNRMFIYCRNFNQPLNNWDVSKVTDMSEMFYNCRNFNKPLLENIVINEIKKQEIINSLPKNIPMELIEHIILKYASYKAWDVSNVQWFLRIFEDSGIREENKPLRFR